MINRPSFSALSCLILSYQWDLSLLRQTNVTQIKIRDRDDNKEVSLGTSKINYMDPRVSVAWCKRHEVPIEKVRR